MVWLVRYLVDLLGINRTNKASWWNFAGRSNKAFRWNFAGRSTKAFWWNLDQIAIATPHAKLISHGKSVIVKANQLLILGTNQQKAKNVASWFWGQIGLWVWKFAMQRHLVSNFDLETEISMSKQCGRVSDFSRQIRWCRAMATGIGFLNVLTPHFQNADRLNFERISTDFQDFRMEFEWTSTDFQDFRIELSLWIESSLII